MVVIKFWVKCSSLLQLHSHIELVYKIGFVGSKRRPTKSVGCSKSLGDQKVQELIYMYNWSFFTTLTGATTTVVILIIRVYSLGNTSPGERVVQVSSSCFPLP